jgi:sugar O-acyltransferase (sialic acid O-acetyltransferase NeuD family)
LSTLYLCGASNPEGVRLALRVNEARARWGSIVLLDDDERRQGEVVLGVPVSGSLSLLGDADPSADEVVNLIARTTRRRFDAALRIATFGVPFASLVHPDVELDEAVLAPGVVVYPRATIGPHVVVGEGSVVFMGAMVGHGSTAGSHCVVAPNAVINARVTLGDRVYVGTNASVLPDLRIGDDSTVAANSAVMRHVRAGSTVIGVPAKTLPAFPAQATPQRPTVRVPAEAS